MVSSVFGYCLQADVIARVQFGGDAELLEVDITKQLLELFVVYRPFQVAAQFFGRNLFGCFSGFSINI